MRERLDWEGGDGTVARASRMNFRWVWICDSVMAFDEFGGLGEDGEGIFGVCEESLGWLKGLLGWVIVRDV